MYDLPVGHVMSTNMSLNMYERLVHVSYDKTLFDDCTLVLVDFLHFILVAYSHDYTNILSNMSRKSYFQYVSVSCLLLSLLFK
jgi:hypothetical protein